MRNFIIPANSAARNLSHAYITHIKRTSSNLQIEELIDARTLTKRALVACAEVQQTYEL